MLKAVLFVAGFALLPGAVSAQSAAVELANLREDVKLFNQRAGDLALKVEMLEKKVGDLERENAALKSSTSYATVAQLNQSVADLRQAIAAGDTATAERAAAQIKKLGDATNDALAAVGKVQAKPVSTPAVTPVFSENFPAEGLTYTVQKGDTLSTIARNAGAKVQDIINANKISDPTKVKVGDTLFIPGGK